MTSSPTAKQGPAQEPASGAEPASRTRRDRLDPVIVKVALAVMFGTSAVGLDSTIVNVAIDRLTREFSASVASVQWVSTGYLLALTVVVPLSGWAAERFGARRMWLASLGLFLIGSMLCGLAWSIPALIAFRVLQGLGGGMLMPLGRTILALVAGQERMGRAMVFVAVPGSLAPVLGPVLGGLVIASAGWRWAFYINLPICLIGLILARRLIPAAAARSGSTRIRLDLLGLLLLTLGLAALVYGLSEAGNHNSFTVVTAWLPLVVGPVLLAGYTVQAFISRAPVIDLRLFKARSFTAATVMLFLLMASMFGSTFLFPLYFQQARHYSVLLAGLVLGVVGVGKGLAMTYTGKLVDRTGAERTIVLIGMALAVLGLLPYAFVGSETGQVLLICGLFVTGLGQGAVTLAAFTATYRGLTPEQVAPATSANRILQQLGGALGTVVLAIILQHATTTQAAPNAFGDTFAWALGLTALAIVPALALPRRAQVESKS